MAPKKFSLGSDASRKCKVFIFEIETREDYYGIPAGKKMEVAVIAKTQLSAENIVNDEFSDSMLPEYDINSIREIDGGSVFNNLFHNSVFDDAYNCGLNAGLKKQKTIKK